MESYVVLHEREDLDLPLGIIVCDEKDRDGFLMSYSTCVMEEMKTVQNNDVESILYNIDVDVMYNAIRVKGELVMNPTLNYKEGGTEEVRISVRKAKIY